MPIRIIIADDHSMVRQGLSAFLALYPDFEVIGTAKTGREALTLALEGKTDVVLMDLMMPDLDGFSATMMLRKELPGVKVLALTGIIDENVIARAFQAGVSGLLLKNLEAEELGEAIKAVNSGQILIAPQAARILAQGLQPVHSPESLTEREKEVLGFLAEGKANKEIARELNLSDKTVKVHVSIILAKLGMQSRTQAAVYAARLGLIPSGLEKI